MISVKCPHCQIGLKVDEAKLPSHITSFKCPKCKQGIPVSTLLVADKAGDADLDTVVLHPKQKQLGSLKVLANDDTSEQVFPLTEGLSVIGRKSSTSSATIKIETSDRSMSRSHLCIEVKNDEKGGYKHLLSDNRSKNNTLYNNSFLEEGEVIVLKDGDEFVIGKTVIQFNK